jgi:hypothetical protein
LSERAPSAFGKVPRRGVPKHGRVRERCSSGGRFREALGSGARQVLAFDLGGQPLRTVDDERCLSDALLSAISDRYE